MGFTSYREDIVERSLTGLYKVPIDGIVKDKARQAKVNEFLQEIEKLDALLHGFVAANQQKRAALQAIKRDLDDAIKALKEKEDWLERRRTSLEAMKDGKSIGERIVNSLEVMRLARDIPQATDLSAFPAEPVQVKVRLQYNRETFRKTIGTLENKIRRRGFWIDQLEKEQVLLDAHAKRMPEQLAMIQQARGQIEQYLLDYEEDTASERADQFKKLLETNGYLSEQNQAQFKPGSITGHDL